jgi:hypothetical protein
MYVIVEQDEAWSIMTLIVSQVLDNADLSDEGRAAVRRWRSPRADGTAEMAGLALGMNEALGGLIDERTDRLVKRRGRFVRSRERESP